MEEKIGVFICTGYGIAEALDIEALTKVANEEFQVALCKKIDFCDPPFLESICDDIKKENLNKVLIAGVSSRRYSDGIFPPDVIVEKLALLEHVVWCQPAGEEDTQMMAEDYLRMYITKLKELMPIDGGKVSDAGRLAGQTALFHSHSSSLSRTGGHRSR
jgi:quinone-modifying oxidoreductase subunit QmoB